MTHPVDIHAFAVGRWKAILLSVGIPPRALTGTHTACPACGGKDRFRFDDKGGSGSFYCNGCGPGNGIELIKRVLRLAYPEALALAKTQAGTAAMVVPRAVRPANAWQKRVLSEWDRAHKLDGRDPASLYLDRRGLTGLLRSSELRYHPRARYAEKGSTPSYHPALIARFVSPDRETTTHHLTFLTDDGHKADVPKVRLLAPVPIPAGGAVRLASSAAVMGIAEGLETALSASKIFGIPVWAALNTANLVKWEPPALATRVIVFGDCDVNYAGQHKAFALANSLHAKKFEVEVQIPPDPGTDWNDVLMQDGV